MNGSQGKSRQDIDRTQAIAVFVEEESLDHEDRLAAFGEVSKLLDHGLTLHQALDAYAVDVLGLSAKEWADIRGCSENSVKQQLKTARKKVGEVLVQ